MSGSCVACPGDLESREDPKQPTATSTIEYDDEKSPGYDSSTTQKCLVVFTTSFVTLAACFSSTSLFSAADQIAANYGTTAEVINASSAGVLFAMGLSNFVWGPISKLCGRLIAFNACIVALLLFTIAGALAPNLEAFVVFRILSGFQGTFFHVTGQAILAEYFPPTRRGTATGFFLSGTVLGPPLGPLVAGVVTTYQSWRVILWTQAGMVLLGLVLSLAVLRKGGRPPLKMNEAGSIAMLRCVLHAFNPMSVFGLMKYPNVLLTDIACGLLSWSQYALLSSPRHILVSQYGLTSPLISALFYLSPAGGFLLGTLLGGRFSDHTVRKWIKLRDEVMPQRRPDAIASKYVVQYMFSAAASGAAVPLIDALGVGIQCVILVYIAGGLCFVTALYGRRMQDWVDGKHIKP
ncbi:synaptic vesicle transporter [Lecanosticta acicola]|uniref:Synaptic vesicle transporter n=1 Tax=Lecanosticta acicola TaxID=111012 RepID=A0AAI8YW25_9PEZI|nr:synaptic vesicle transporter [Lecanosticta acicola]